MVDSNRCQEKQIGLLTEFACRILVFEDSSPFFINRDRTIAKSRSLFDTCAVKKYTSTVTPDLSADPSNLPLTAPSTAGMTTQVVKGSLWTLLGQVLPLGVSLITTPFVIRFLGAEGYGVLILVGLIPTYLVFADFGMSLASTKFASEAYAEGDTQKEARIVRTAALIALTASLPFGIAIFALAGWIVVLFNVPEPLLAEASLALKFASVTFVLNLLNAIFNTPQLTRLRMDLNTLVNSGFRILGLIATPIVLYLGSGIARAVFVMMVVVVLTLAAHIYTSRRLLPTLLATTIDTSMFRPLLLFGTGLSIATVASVFLTNIEKIFLPPVVSIQALAYFSIAFTLASMATVFAGSMVQSLIPAFSRLLSHQTREEFDTLFSRAIRLNLILIPILLVALCVCARPFLTVWAGEEFGRESTVPFYILLLGLFMNLVAYVPYSAIVACGRADALAKLYWIEVVVFSGVTFVLISIYGISGAAAAWSLRATVDGIILVSFAERITGTTLTWASYSGHTLVGIVLLAPPIISTLFFEMSVFWLVPIFLISSAFYFSWMMRHLLDVDEKTWLQTRLCQFFAL